METVTSITAPKAIGPYSQAKIVGDLVFLSGQIPINPKTEKVVDGDIKSQTRQIISNIDNILKSAGTSLEKVIKTTCYLTDIADFDAFNDVYGEYFVEKPARTLVEVSALPKGVDAEIEVVAELK